MIIVEHVLTVMLALGLKEIFVFKMIRLLETLIALNGLMDFV